MASESGTLYIGVTNDLVRRVFEHREGAVDGFTFKYGCKKLVYFEDSNSIEVAITREKQLKKWRREKKEYLIRSRNPRWLDLYPSIV
jgi:putative endonuclease